MMRAEDLIAALAPLDRAELEIWIAEEYVTASREADTYVFSDRECARVRLLRSLRYEMEIEIDTLPVILSLLDQLYDSRRQLRALGAAIASLDGPTRQTILSRLAPAEMENEPH